MPNDIGLDKQTKHQRTVVKIFLPIILAHVLSAKKNRLIETVHWSSTTYVLVEK